jgi:hypothetical protein
MQCTEKAEAGRGAGDENGLALEIGGCRRLRCGTGRERGNTGQRCAAKHVAAMGKFGHGCHS